jgi:hypothetical protein
MKRTTRILGAAGAAVLVGVAIGGGVAVAGSIDDAEVPISGDAYDRATAAALDHLGEGRVSETEEGDEDSYYEVEVTLDDGRQVDVQLDEAFNVVGDAPDGDDGSDTD